MKRTLTVMLLALAVVVPVGTQTASAAITARCTKAAPTTAAGYQALFDIHTSTWSGGDGGFSVKLSDGRSIWLFSDTFVGALNADGSRSAGSHLINNSAIIQDKGCVTPVVGAKGSDGKLTALIKPKQKDGSYYWIANAWAEGGSVKLLLMRNVNGPKGFEYKGMDIGTIKVSGNTVSVQSISTTPVSGPSNIGWGASVTQDSSYTYIYGTESQGWGDRQTFVARAPKLTLGFASTWRFWNGSNWVSDIKALKPIIPFGNGISSGFSIDKNSKGTYVLATHGYDFFTQDTYIFTSKSPAGPWTKVATYAHKNVTTEGVTVGQGLVYQSDLHPEIVLSSGKTLLTYAVNSGTWNDNIKNGRLYGLRFQEIPNFNLLK